MKTKLLQSFKWAICLISFSLISFGQIHLAENESIKVSSNVDTPAGGTELGNAIQRANCAETDEEKMRQKIDSTRIANGEKLF